MENTCTTFHLHYILLKYLQKLMNMSLPDKCISMNSCAMVDDTQYDESITNKVKTVIEHPEVGHSFLLHPYSKQIFQEITHTMEILMKKITVIIFLICKATYSWFGIFLIDVSKSFNAATRSVGSSMMLDTTSFSQVLFLFYQQSTKEVKMRWELQMRPFSHVFQPNLTSHMTE